jgi:DNA-binding NtrC family response regulator
MKVLLTFTGSHDPFAPSAQSGEMNAGPVLTVAGSELFEHIYLFATPRMAEQTAATAAELRTRHAKTTVHVCDTPLKDPTNYVGILRQLRKHFGRISKAHSEADYYVAVSSGTPHMHACWLLLVASGEIPATILQSIPPEFTPPGEKNVREIDLSPDDFPQVVLRERRVDPSNPEVEILEARRELAIVGDDDALLRSLHEAAAYAGYEDTHVLVLGETGTGKEGVANFIHQLSSRASRPFVVVNCSGIPPALAESQLFGHRKGSFTGATSDHPGKFKAANNGTLFLDELGELPLAAQAKLLRALEKGEIEPVGESQPVRVNVRIVAATNRDLRAMVASGGFRQDLYERFGATITLPPLRHRKTDIPKLALHLLGEWNRRYQRQRRLSAKALTALTAYAWPGNVRELRRVINQSAMLTDRSVIRSEDLKFELPLARSSSDAVPEPEPGFSLLDYLESQRGRIIKRALEKTDHVQARAARLLGLSPQALNQFLKTQK